MYFAHRFTGSDSYGNSQVGRKVRIPGMHILQRNFGFLMSHKEKSDTKRSSETFKHCPSRSKQINLISALRSQVELFGSESFRFGILIRFGNAFVLSFQLTFWQMHTIMHTSFQTMNLSKGDSKRTSRIAFWHLTFYLRCDTSVRLSSFTCGNFVNLQDFPSFKDTMWRTRSS